MDESVQRSPHPADAQASGEPADSAAADRPELREVDLGQFDPFEIDFLPRFRQGRGPEKPFINEYGVLIGDHEYASPNSPLEQWTKQTDPMVMAGDQWVHPFKDIGFQTEENREYFEKGILPEGAVRGGRFMHPDKDVAYEASLENVDGEPPPGPIDGKDDADPGESGSL